MQRKHVILFLSLFLSTSLAGCFNDQDDCWSIPWPEPGFSGQFAAHYPDKSESQPINWTVEHEEVRRGDGLIVPVITLKVADGAWMNHYSVSTGDMIVAWNPGHGFHLNMGDWPVNLWGRCLATGDQVARPYGDGTLDVVFEVISTDPALVIEKRAPPAATPRFPAGPGTTLRMVWHEEAPFPHETSRITGADEPPPNVAVMKNQNGPVVFRNALEEERSPLAVRPTVDGTPCWERHLRHPDLTALPANASFGGYVTNMTSDEALGRYLADHGRACAVWVNYEIVTEESSTAYVWTSIFADGSAQNFVKRWVVRCYHEDHLVLLYGDCAERPHYRPLDKLGRVQGVAVDPLDVGLGVDLKNLLNNHHRLNGDLNFTRFTWRIPEAAVGNETSMALQPKPTDHYAPAVEFDYGTLRGDVRYVTSSGEIADGYTWKSDIMYYFPTGVAYLASTYHVRPVEAGP